MYCPNCKKHYSNMMFFKFNERGYAVGHFDICHYCRIGELPKELTSPPPTWSQQQFKEHYDKDKNNG